MQILKELKVAHATGGTVFYVDPKHWNAILEIVGGWPGESPEITGAELAIAEYAGKRRSGQGYSLDANLRQVRNAESQSLL
jgi:hypothetical protein